MPKEEAKEEEKGGGNEDKPKGKPQMIKQEKLYEVMKALTAMKLVKEDPTPGEVLPYLFIGGIGTAYNKEAMQSLGITHVLTCAANIRPRFENVSGLFDFYPIYFDRILCTNNFPAWIRQTKQFYPILKKQTLSSKQPSRTTWRESLQRTKF